MVATHRISGVTFTQRIGQEFPTIPALRSMIYFGTGPGNDGNEGNRVAGGAVPSVISGSPVHSSNYVTVGFQATPNRYDVLDTNVQRDNSWYTSGWTGMAVARHTLGSGNYNDVMSDQNFSPGSPGQAGAVFGFGLQGGNNRAIAFMGGIANRGTIQFTSSVANWKIVAYTVPAGAQIGMNYQLFEFTENQAGQGISVALLASYATAPTPPMSVHFGSHSLESSVGYGSVDVAWGMVAQQVLPQALMAQIAAAARAWLGRRGIVC